MGLRREACHVADRADDLGGQDGTHAEDLGEGGARGLHLGLYATVQVRDLLVLRPDVAQYLRGQASPEAGRGALGTYASQDARCAVGRKRSRYPAGEEVPK